MALKTKKDAHWDETVNHPLIGKIEDWGRKSFYRIFSFFAASKAQSAPDSLSLQDLKSILLIKEPYRMGDLLQITPLLRELRKSFPDLYIGLVVQDRNFFIFKDNPHLNEIFVFEKRKLNRCPWKLVPFILKIRQRKFDLAATLETQRTHLTNDLIAYFSGAPLRLRYEGSAFGNRDSDIFYNLLAPQDPGAVHEVDKNFGVFKPWGIHLRDRSLFLQISQEDLQSAKVILKTIFRDRPWPLTAPLIAIHPGSYKINNRWPLQNYLEAGKKLKDSGVEILFILGPAERDWEDEIKERKFHLVSRISVLEMAALFSLSQAVLCNDTGIMHIAAAVGTKTTALFGETNPLHWKPPGELVKIVQSPDKNVSSIEVHKVLAILSS